MSDYLSRLKRGRGHRYGWSLRKLYALVCQHKAEDVLKAVDKAGEHGLLDVGRIESIILADLAHQDYLLPMESQEYEDSDAYRKGAGTPPSDLSGYAIDPDAPEGESNDQ